MSPRRSCLTRTVILSSLLGLLPVAGTAQSTRFFALGGGASIPTGSASSAMNPGWLIEMMGGVSLPGNTVSLRLGASYGQNGMDATAGGSAMMGRTERGIDRTLGAMAAVMLMPDSDRDLIPYMVAGGGIMHVNFRGSTTSFAWTTGIGARLQTDVAEFYAECRFLSSNNGRGHGDMVPLTAGVRLGTW